MQMKIDLCQPHEPCRHYWVTTDEQGTVYSNCNWWPFGDQQSCTAWPVTDISYAGMERDQQTGLDHTWFRYYNPRLGRFMSADPLGGSIGDPQSLNRFGYVLNDPTNLIDPLGLKPPLGCGRSDACITSRGGYYYDAFNFSFTNDPSNPGRVGGAYVLYVPYGPPDDVSYDPVLVFGPDSTDSVSSFSPVNSDSGGGRSQDSDKRPTCISVWLGDLKDSAKMAKNAAWEAIQAAIEEETKQALGPPGEDPILDLVQVGIEAAKTPQARAAVAAAAQTAFEAYAAKASLKAAKQMRNKIAKSGARAAATAAVFLLDAALTKALFTEIQAIRNGSCKP